jgi:hypothetical protein
MVLTYCVTTPIILVCGLWYMGFKHLVDRFVIMYIYGHKKRFAANKGVLSFDFKSHQKQVRSINQLVIVMMCIFVGSMTIFFSTRVRGTMMLLPHAILSGILLLVLICVFIGYYTSLNFKTFFFQRIWYPLKRRWTKDVVQDDAAYMSNYEPTQPSNLVQSSSGSMYLKPPLPTKLKTGKPILDDKRKRRVRSFDILEKISKDQLSASPPPSPLSISIDDVAISVSVKDTLTLPATPDSPLTGAPVGRLRHTERRHKRGTRSYGSDEFTQMFYPSTGVAVTPSRLTPTSLDGDRLPPSIYLSKRFRQAYEPPFKYLQLLLPDENKTPSKRDQTKQKEENYEAGLLQVHVDEMSQRSSIEIISQ